MTNIFIFHIANTASPGGLGAGFASHSYTSVVSEGFLTSHG